MYRRRAERYCIGRFKYYKKIETVSKKKKKEHFAENETFDNVLQPEFAEVFGKDYKYKGCWNKEFWHNDNPITVELGCGKGEYSVGLAKMFPSKNFIGIDIKGARFWRGAKTSQEESIKNVAFVRTSIELIPSFFGENELNEIWITFPDPQLKRRRAKKRLTGPLFLNKYRKMLSPDGTVNLKTDSFELYTYTMAVLAYNNITPVVATDDLYASEYADEVLSIKTHYEGIFLERGKKINYIKFSLKRDQEILDLPEEMIFE